MGRGHCSPPNTYDTFFPKQFTVRGSQSFLKMCPPFVSLLVSALFRWPCSTPMHGLLSSKFGACTAGVRPFPLATQHFYSFVLFSRFGACTAGIRPFPFSSISIHLSPR